jgi:hypothetical protein
MDLNKLKKLESPGPRRAAGSEGGTVTAVIKVKRDGYRPAGVKVRGEISGSMFTAEFPEAKLAELEQDAEVASVALSRSLRVQKSKT